MTDIEPLRAKFIQTLIASGATKDPRWLAAFRDVPRGSFVPYYFTQTTDRFGWVLVESPSPQWAAGVYSNQPLITQLNGDETLTETARQGQPVNGVSTSSSSAPSLMALMLEALSVHDAPKILEIGTGTGYNTALLCHRVGPKQVSSVDIDPRLINTARQRLAALGYAPHLANLDGTAGCAARAPFDRIIATVAVHSLPREWIAQTRIGGTIVVPLDRRNCGGLLVRLTVGASGVAHGRFLPDFGGFMPMRQFHRHDAADHAFRTIDGEQGDTRRTDLPVEIIADEANPFEFFAALTVPGDGWNHLTFTPSNGAPPKPGWLKETDLGHATPRAQTASTPSAKADPPGCGIRSKPRTSNGTGSTVPPATGSVSPSTTTTTPSGLTTRTPHTAGYFPGPQSARLKIESTDFAEQGIPR